MEKCRGIKPNIKILEEVEFNSKNYNVVKKSLMNFNKHINLEPKIYYGTK